MTEREIQRRVVALFRSAGCYVAVTSQNRTSRVSRGLPDLIVLLPRGKGIVLFECKGLGGKLSKDQLEFANAAHYARVEFQWGGVGEAEELLVNKGLLVYRGKAA